MPWPGESVDSPGRGVSAPASRDDRDGPVVEAGEGQEARVDGVEGVSPGAAGSWIVMLSTPTGSPVCAVVVVFGVFTVSVPLPA